MVLAQDREFVLTANSVVQSASEKLCARAARAAFVWLLAAAGAAHAGDGPFGIDHELTLDQSGIWARKYQTALENGVIATEVVGALWLGNDDDRPMRDVIGGGLPAHLFHDIAVAVR